jgi:hypothetical protein
MNMTEAVIVLSDVIEIEKIAEDLLTQDGRWEALQAWLDGHPKWRAEVNKWVDLTPHEAFCSLRNYAANRAKMPPVILDTLIDPGMKWRISKSIQTLQAMYRERKEIKA